MGADTMIIDPLTLDQIAVIVPMSILLGNSSVDLDDDAAVVNALTNARFNAAEIVDYATHAIERAKEIRKARQS